MCDYEEFIFECRHSEVRLKSYCHFARNRANHTCPGVKVLRKSWVQHLQICDDCVASGYRLSHSLHRVVAQQQTCRRG